MAKQVLKPGEKIINLKEKVTVYATKKAKGFKEGQVIKCHPKVAEHMVKTGWAVNKSNKKENE